MGDYTSSNGMSGDVNHARNPPTQKDPSSKPQSRDSYRLAQELNDLHIKVIISFKTQKRKFSTKMLRLFFDFILIQSHVILLRQNGIRSFFKFETLTLYPFVCDLNHTKGIVPSRYLQNRIQEP